MTGSSDRVLLKQKIKSQILYKAQNSLVIYAAVKKGFIKGFIIQVYGMHIQVQICVTINNLISLKIKLWFIENIFQ